MSLSCSQHKRKNKTQPPTASHRTVRISSLEKLGLQDISPTPFSTCRYNLSYGKIADSEAQYHDGVFVQLSLSSVFVLSMEKRKKGDMLFLLSLLVLWSRRCILLDTSEYSVTGGLSLSLSLSLVKPTHACSQQQTKKHSTGAFNVDTGKFTGRSPSDKYIVDQKPSSGHIWWGEINQKMDPEVWKVLKERVMRI